MRQTEVFQSDKFNLNTSLVLKDLPPEIMTLLERNKTTHTYKKGQTIFREQSFPAGIFILETGMAKKFKTDNLSNQYIIYICTAGEILGLQSVLSTERFLDSAATLLDSEIAFIPREDFLEAVNLSPQLANRLLKILGHEFGVLINTLSLQAQRTVKERLIINLITLHEKFRKPENTQDTVTISISRTDLACMTGATRETIVRLLGELKDAGLIHTSGSRIRITDYNALMAMVDY